jgi:hypothetical protein
MEVVDHCPTTLDLVATPDLVGVDDGSGLPPMRTDAALGEHRFRCCKRRAPVAFWHGRSRPDMHRRIAVHDLGRLAS